MKNVIIILFFISISFAGCASKSNVSHAVSQGVTMWETGDNGLEFVVFSSMSKGESVGSNTFDFSFLQEGSTEYGPSARITWPEDLTSVNITGHEYSFEKGRVFILLANGKHLKIEQLNIPIRKKEYIQSEIRRLSNTPQVKSYFN